MKFERLKSLNDSFSFKEAMMSSGSESFFSEYNGLFTHLTCPGNVIRKKLSLICRVLLKCINFNRGFFVEETFF